jgi:hypothetical protein
MTNLTKFFFNKVIMSIISLSKSNNISGNFLHGQLAELYFDQFVLKLDIHGEMQDFDQGGNYRIVIVYQVQIH